MPAPRRSKSFGGSSAHERLMMANLAASLFAAEGIETTEAKAKALRPIAERLISKAKRRKPTTLPACTKSARFRRTSTTKR
ncbi:MAG: bL17 family ribosomal protein [Actinomycetota bacterium]